MDNTEIENLVTYQLYNLQALFTITPETEEHLFVVYGHWTEMMGCFVDYIS